jgi:hypothetical protein
MPDPWQAHKSVNVASLILIRFVIGGTTWPRLLNAGKCQEESDGGQDQPIYD